MKLHFILAAGLMLTLAASLAGSPPAEQHEFVVIVNTKSQIKELSASKLRVIFLRKISRWPWGAEIYPVDLPDTSSVRRAFAKDVLQSTTSDLGVYWIDQKSTRNVGPPPIVLTAEDVKAAVAAQPGGIGYIPASALDPTVKTLAIVR